MRSLPSLLLAASLTASCGFLFDDFANPATRYPSCTTPCGEIVYTLPDAGTSSCDAWLEAEAVTVEVFSARWPDACERLSDVRASARGPAPESDGGWYLSYGVHVAGLMDCKAEPDELNIRNGYAHTWMEVLGEDFTTNAYAHEAAHVLSCPDPNSAHAGWSDPGGIYADIEVIQARLRALRDARKTVAP